MLKLRLENVGSAAALPSQRFQVYVGAVGGTDVAQEVKPTANSRRFWT